MDTETRARLDADPEAYTREMVAWCDQCDGGNCGDYTHLEEPGRPDLVSCTNCGHCFETFLWTKEWQAEQDKKEADKNKKKKGKKGKNAKKAARSAIGKARTSDTATATTPPAPATPPPADTKDNSEDTDDELYGELIAAARRSDKLYCGEGCHFCGACRDLYLVDQVGALFIVCLRCHVLQKRAWKVAKATAENLAFPYPDNWHPAESDFFDTFTNTKAVMERMTDDKALAIKRRVFASKDALARDSSVPLDTKKEMLAGYVSALVGGLSGGHWDALRSYGFLTEEDEDVAWQKRPFFDRP